MSVEKRDITKIIRFSNKEYRLIMERASENEMNLSAYLRFAGMNTKATDPKMRQVIIKLINEVNYIGHNINQIVRNNNSGLYYESDKTRLMEYMRTLNSKVGELAQKYGY